jgi:hypothetical protein
VRLVELQQLVFVRLRLGQSLWRRRQELFVLLKFMVVLDLWVAVPWPTGQVIGG